MTKDRHTMALSRIAQRIFGLGLTAVVASGCTINVYDHKGAPLDNKTMDATEQTADQVKKPGINIHFNHARDKSYSNDNPALYAPIDPINPYYSRRSYYNRLPHGGYRHNNIIHLRGGVYTPILGVPLISPVIPRRHIHTNHCHH